MASLDPGTVVAGRYAIVRPLGRGATKQVFLADDRLAGGQVALALLVADDGIDPTMAARFSREGKAASVLRSRYTVQVFDSGKLADGTRYLASEAVIGRGLDEALGRGAVAPALAARWTAQVLVALSEAHARGIFHRDVKPENVLLAPSGAGEVAKLTDFGLAKVLDSALEGSMQLRTAQNVVLGTPEYMAPEQWQGGVVDARTDVYATGVMLYELLVGRPPFESKHVHGLCVAHLTQEAPRFPARVEAAAATLEPVALRALAKHPRDRFPSADAMRVAIEEVTGFRVEVDVSRPEAPAVTPCGHAELVSESWPGVVHLIAAPNVVIGRDGSANVMIQCLPRTDENELRTRTISRFHARIDWRGGRPFVTDLESRTGTRVGAAPVAKTPREIRHGEELVLGKHVRVLFEHAPAAAGELPRWARLTRTDDAGGGQVFVLVLREVKISSGADAAVQLPAPLAAGDMLRVRSEGGVLVALGLGAAEGVPLRDGDSLRVGRVAISVATSG